MTTMITTSAGLKNAIKSTVREVPIPAIARMYGVLHGEQMSAADALEKLQGSKAGFIGREVAVIVANTL